MLERDLRGVGPAGHNLPIAVLEKHGDELVVLCHHGFGPEGWRRSAALAESFSSLVMSRGQTGFLEDLALRPDLVVPRPRHGEPIRSVLAAPLRVHGRCVGTVEVYGPRSKPGAMRRSSWSSRWPPRRR